MKQKEDKAPQQGAEQNLPHGRFSAMQPLILMHEFLRAKDKREIKSLKEANTDEVIENAIERFTESRYEQQELYTNGMPDTAKKEFEELVDSFLEKC